MNLLFVCTHNACRSILCEAIARKLGAGRIRVSSSGSHPAGRIHPLTLEHLGRRGYDTRGLSSKSWAEVEAFEPDVVITVCDSATRESCPTWLGTACKVHWGLPDPTALTGGDEDREAAFDELITTIESRISTVLEQPVESLTGEQLARVLTGIGDGETLRGDADNRT